MCIRDRANVDALSRWQSDLPSSAGWPPSSSLAHESVCTAIAQCHRLLPSENTAFRDNIPQRLEPLGRLQPITDAGKPLLSPLLWPAAADDESLSVKVVPSHHQFRPIGTPSTTDSELSEMSTAAAEATSTADTLTDFTALMMSDVLADSHDTYQRFVICREYETDESNLESERLTCQTFQPSFRVHCELEKAAQTGERSPPVSVSADVDLRLGCLVKQVLSQLSGEFPEGSSNVDDILDDPNDSANDTSCPEDQIIDETSVSMSRRLSVIWNDAAGPDGVGLDSCPPTSSDLSMVSCHMSQIWTDSATTITDTSSSSFVSTHGRQMSDIWSDATVQLADSTRVDDNCELLPSVVPNIWKDTGQQARMKGSRLRRMWKSVDSDDTAVISSGGMFKPQSIWSHSRPNSVTAEVETLHPVLEDGDLITYGCGRKSSSMEAHSDECSVSPSELDILWGTASSEKSPTTDADDETCADENIFHEADLRNSLLGKDNIWSHSEMEVHGVESGVADLKAAWNVDPLYCNEMDMYRVEGGGADLKTPWNVDPLFCSEMDAFRVKSGGADLNSLWNVDPLYCTGNNASSSLSVGGCDTIHSDFILDPLPFWIGSETNLDADVAFAFTHLVSGVVSTPTMLLSFCVFMDCFSIDMNALF